MFETPLAAKELYSALLEETTRLRNEIQTEYLAPLPPGIQSHTKDTVDELPFSLLVKMDDYHHRQGALAMFCATGLAHAAAMRGEYDRAERRGGHNMEVLHQFDLFMVDLLNWKPKHFSPEYPEEEVQKRARESQERWTRIFTGMVGLVVANQDQNTMNVEAARESVFSILAECALIRFDSTTQKFHFNFLSAENYDWLLRVVDANTEIVRASMEYLNARKGGN